VGLALIEAGEHVLATAKHFLRSSPGAESPAARHLRLAGPAGQGDEALGEGDRGRPQIMRGSPVESRESVEYEGEW
jgi:hypothetical protein